MAGHTHEEGFCLSCFLNDVDPLLPVQGPIKDFIAGTKVPLFVPLPFDEGLSRAEALYRSRSYMDLGYYREKFDCKDISSEAIDDAIRYHLPTKTTDDVSLVRHALFNFFEIYDEKTFQQLLKRKNISPDDANQLMQRLQQKTDPQQKPSARFVLQKRVDAPMDHNVNAILFRLLGAYVDQGVNLWPFLDRFSSFKQAVVMLATKSKLPLADFVNNHDIANILNADSDEVITSILGKVFTTQASYRNFLFESVLDHPGWSGMVNMIEKFPNSLAKRRPITLKDFIAVKLSLEWQFIKAKCPRFMPIQPDEVAPGDFVIQVNDKSRVHSLALWILSAPSDIMNMALASNLSQKTLQKIWHHALEHTYYRQAASIILEQKPSPMPTSKSYQAVFCIDDRECSLRRHLEEENPSIETFGYAGFFNVDCYFKAHQKDLLDKMCPLPVTPHHVIIEKSAKKEKAGKNRGLLEFASFISLHGANSTLFGFISAYTIGHLSLFRLLLSFLQPFKIFKIKQLAAQEKTILQYKRHNDAQKLDDLFIGYSESEMADRVFGLLNNMGLRQGIAPLVFIIGHGSSSVNNPHFAAYDCGACSGRPGAMNARVFAAMANLPSVRALVKEKGIEIPDDTRFVGGFHDTCTDVVSFFDVEELSKTQSQSFLKFNEHMNNACGKNALERCRKFALVPEHITPKQALAEVAHRSRALFEPRPELGHATNALTIVGRRSRSYLKNLDRRAFLQSYDPHNDPTGAILGNLLNAVIPVCGGINLEYMFSRIDPAVHGCGTKLSHNVCSLIGVGNGLDDDLRTGLPIQTTEIHIPIRLMIVIEQKPDIIVQVINANPNLRPWLVHGWVKIASLDIERNHISMFDHQTGEFMPLLSA